MEFYQTRRTKWSSNECKPWEIWRLSFSNKNVLSFNRQSFVDEMTELVSSIIQALSKHKFLPKMPIAEDIGLVYETKYSDIQPYLFNITVSSTNDKYASTNDLSKTSVTDKIKSFLNVS